MTLTLAAVGVVAACAACAACDRGGASPPGASPPASGAGPGPGSASAVAAAPAAPAASIPWQPHGFRAPTVRCELAAPEGLTKSPSPMGDHIAELMGDGAKTVVIVAERVEPNVAAARERALAYYRSGLLTAEGARTVTDGALEGARATGHVLSLRTGPPGAGRIESLFLLAFDGLPVVEIVARHDETDARARDAVMALARTARCTK